MATPLLATKLYIPPLRSRVVRRPRLVQRLNEGLPGKLTLISAPAGFGKTTLITEWLTGCERPTAWLALDEGDRDPARFLAYLVAAVRTVAPTVGAAALTALQSPPHPPSEALLTALLNDVSALADPFVLVLDDYHVLDAQPIDQALTFLLDHLPPQLHLVIATREDPHLPLARLRARGQLTELRAADLRFTESEAAEFLNQTMGLTLAADDIATLATRTEGWVASLQLAAISLRGQRDPTRFIAEFTGSHRFVLDYLAEEVLQPPADIQTFLLRTSILDRLSGPLCDAVLLAPAGAGQATLEALERANLFIVPLDGERRWYRYHHLFADLLRQHAGQHGATSSDGEEWTATELHRRASQWYEDNGLELEAFQQAAAAHDVERAARLLEGKGMPLHFRGAITPVLRWLESLPKPALDANPSLWVMYASALSMTLDLSGVEPKLQAAEAVLQTAAPDEKTRNLIGHIAAIRAVLAAAEYQVDACIAQSQRALEYLHPNNVPVRTATTWKLGWAYQVQGDRAAASRAYTEAMSIGQASGNTIIYLGASAGLGTIQEAQTQLHLAAATYQHILELAGEPPLPVACDAHLGLARLCYEWNDLDAAQEHAHQSLQLARQVEYTDRLVAAEVALARLKLAQGDAPGAMAVLAGAAETARERNIMHRMPEIAAAQVLTLLRQGHLAAATQLAQAHELPICRARVLLAQGDPSGALAELEPWQRQVEAREWADERLKVLLLQAVAFQAHGEQDQAAHLLGDALALAEPSGFIRSFVDEGIPMTHLLTAAIAHGMLPDYARKLLAAFDAEPRQRANRTDQPSDQPLIEPLSRREREILQLIAQGLSNQEISERLFLALDTVKGHNRRIYSKLQVQRRTEAIAKARSLHMLPAQ